MVDANTRSIVGTTDDRRALVKRTVGDLPRRAGSALKHSTDTNLPPAHPVENPKPDVMFAAAIDLGLEALRGR